MLRWHSGVGGGAGGVPAVAASASASPTIGILDIFGFERLERNSLEQFFVNYANEKLHAHFIEQAFQWAQDQYQADGQSTVCLMCLGCARFTADPLRLQASRMCCGLSLRVRWTPACLACSRVCRLMNAASVPSQTTSVVWS